MNVKISRIYSERTADLDALAAQRMAERTVKIASHARARADLDAKCEADLAAHDAASIEQLEQREKDVERRRAECEADIANEDVPPLKERIAAFLQAPSPGGAEAVGVTWRALAERCRLELGDEPHQAVLLAGLAGDLAPRLGNAKAFDLFHRDATGEKWKIEGLGRMQLMSKLLAVAGELEARLAKLSPDEAKFAELTQYVARRSVERCVGIMPAHHLAGEMVFDGRTWRKVPPGSTPAEVIKTSSIAEAFRSPPPSTAPSYFSDRQSRTSNAAGRSNEDLASVLSVGKAYLR